MERSLESSLDKTRNEAAILIFLSVPVFPLTADLIDGKLANQNVASLFHSRMSIVLLGWGTSPSENW